VVRKQFEISGDIKWFNSQIASRVITTADTAFIQHIPSTITGIIINSTSTTDATIISIIRTTVSLGLFNTVTGLERKNLRGEYSELSPTLLQLLDELAEYYLQWPEMEYQRCAHNNNQKFQR